MNTAIPCGCFRVTFRRIFSLPWHSKVLPPSPAPCEDETALRPLRVYGTTGRSIGRTRNGSKKESGMTWIGLPRREGLLCICAALLCALLSFLMLSAGPTLTTDGWGYWEGSVSLLEGQG
jgi:hypothetical protein